MGKKKEELKTSTAYVTNVGYDRNARTVLYLYCELGDAFGVKVKVYPEGTPFEAYDATQRDKLIGRNVLYSYDEVVVVERVPSVVGAKFIEFIEG